MDERDRIAMNKDAQGNRRDPMLNYYWDWTGFSIGFSVAKQIVKEAIYNIPYLKRTNRNIERLVLDKL